MAHNTSHHDPERRQRIADALQQHQLDAVVCALPSRVLLLTGYYPVVGTSLAIATKEQQVLTIAPEDEEQLARAGFADEVITYKPSRLDRLEKVEHAAVPPLHDALRRLRLEQSRIGFEHGPSSEPASYSAMNFFGGSMRTMLQEAAPHLLLDPADEMLDRLASVKTPPEVECIRLACKVAARAFEECRLQLRPGMSEFEAAALLRSGFSVYAPQFGVARPEGFAWCMSGPNSAEAAHAYARSRHRHLATGDLVLMHANSCANGYWTDITRTYTVGERDDRKQQLYSAIFQAREAALNAICPALAAAMWMLRRATAWRTRDTRRSSSIPPGTASAFPPSRPMPCLGCILHRTTCSRSGWSSTWSRRSISTATAASATATWLPLGKKEQRC